MFDLPVTVLMAIKITDVGVDTFSLILKQQIQLRSTHAALWLKSFGIFYPPASETSRGVY